MTIETIAEKIHTMDMYIRESNARIEKHLEKLNGKVASNVLSISKIKQWKAWTIGFGCCFSMVLLPIVFIIAKSYL